MKKIMVIFGTRPEAIKMAPLVKEIDHNGKLRSEHCDYSTTLEIC